MSFTKNIGKNLSGKYSKKRIDSTKKSTSDAIKTTSKKAIQKTEEATGDLIGNKIADKMTSVSKKSKKLHFQNKSELKIPKKRYISPEKDNKLLMN